jgi:hypothetical protein
VGHGCNCTAGSLCTSTDNPNAACPRCKCGGNSCDCTSTNDASHYCQGVPANRSCDTQNVTKCPCGCDKEVSECGQGCTDTNAICQNQASSGGGEWKTYSAKSEYKGPSGTVIAVVTVTWDEFHETPDPDDNTKDIIKRFRNLKWVLDPRLLSTSQIATGTGGGIGYVGGPAIGASNWTGPSKPTGIGITYRTPAAGGVPAQDPISMDFGSAEHALNLKVEYSEAMPGAGGPGYWGIKFERKTGTFTPPPTDITAP